MARVNVLERSIEYSLFHLSWPLVVSMAFQTVYNIVDSFFLGKLGPIQFSASTMTWPVIFTFISLAMGFSSAGISIVSQSEGKGDRALVARAAAQLYLVTLTVGVAATIVGLLLAEEIVGAIAGKESAGVVPFALGYYTVDMLGLPLVFLLHSTGAIARALGDAQFGMRIMLYMNLINMALDPLLIFGLGPFPRLGVVGAAWATNAGRFFAAVASARYVFLRGSTVKLRIEDFRPDWRLIGLIFRIGLPNAVGMSVTSAGFAVIMKYVAMFGPTVISAYGIGNRVTNLVSMISFGLAGAVSTMVGQFIGAGRYGDAERTVHTAFVWNVIAIGVLSVLTFAFGKEVTKFFINEARVIEMGEIYFRYISFSMPIFTAYMIYNSALVGAGKTFLTMVGDVLRLWAIRIPIIAALSLTVGFKGVFIGMIVSNLIVFFVTYAFFRFSDWRRAIV